MKRSKLGEERIVRIFKEVEAGAMNRPGVELTPQKLDGHDAAGQAVLLSRYSTGLSPCNPSLMRSWL
jgi:hypothetical protein